MKILSYYPLFVENITSSVKSIITILRQRSFWIMLCFGFSAGMPLALIFGTLSLWLNEANIEKSTITFFSWAALGYSFKFIWAPLIDQLTVPLLTKKLGRRRSWLLISQLMIIIAITGMAMTDPIVGESKLLQMAFFAVLLGFSSATQDIVIDAYRIESVPANLQALIAASYSAGYRIAMITSGGFALYLSALLGSEKGNYLYLAWQTTYIAMACLMLVGLITSLLIKECENSSKTLDAKGSQQLLLLFILLLIPFISLFYFSSPLIAWLKPALVEFFNNKILTSFLLSVLRLGCIGFICFLFARLIIKLNMVSVTVAKSAYWSPLKEFLQRYPLKTVVLLLLMIGFYRVSDIVLGIIANIFYQDIGFNKASIFAVVKTFGVVMTIVGSFIGGFLSLKFGVMRILLLGAVLSALTNLLFIVLASQGNDIFWLYIVISADNLSAGVASIAFVAFLSQLTNVQFTATQYAMFTSIMLLFPKIIGGYSGTFVAEFGYTNFFIFTTLIGLPIILLVYIVGEKLSLKSKAVNLS